MRKEKNAKDAKRKRQNHLKRNRKDRNEKNAKDAKRKGKTFKRETAKIAKVKTKGRKEIIQ